MSDSKRGGRLILRGARWTALGFAVRFGARLLFLFIAGRLLGAAAFGAFALAVAVVETCVTIGGLGTKKTLFQLLDRREGAGGRSHSHILLDAALLVAVASLALAGLVMAAAVALHPGLLSGSTAIALFALAPMIAGQALLDLFLAASRWTQAIRYEVVARSFVEPYALAAAAAAAYYAGLPGYALLIGYWAGTLAALVYAFVGARSRLGGLRISTYRPDRAVLGATLRSGAANTATDLLNALYTRVDLYLVGILLGEGPAGIYGMARQIAAPIRQVRQSFDGLLIPMVARMLSVKGSGETGHAMASTSRLILVLQFPFLITIIAVGAPLLDWFGPGFAAGYWALVALAVAETIQASLSVGDLVFVYLRPGVGLRLTLLSIAVGILTAFIAIPYLGISGAALSVLAAYAVRAWLRRLTLRLQFGVVVPAGHHAGPLIAAALGVAAIMLANRLDGLSPAAIDLAAFVGGLAFYAAAIFAWLLIADETLALKGFAEAPEDDGLV